MEPWLVSQLGEGVCPPLLESTLRCLECATVGLVSLERQQN